MSKLRLFLVLVLVGWGIHFIPADGLCHAQVLQWHRVVSGGFMEDVGDIMDLAEFNGYLYACGWTGEKSVLWRSADGYDWEKVDIYEEMEHNTLYLLKTFNNYFYAGTINRDTGAQLWRSPDGLNWDLIEGGGFGHSNVGFYSMSEFNGYLYAGLWCDFGGQVWRSPDGLAWEKVSTNGFGNPNNVAIWSLAEFNGYLYAGTDKYTDGAEIWRTSNGTTWERVVANGFGNSQYNDVVTDLAVFNGYIYAACMTHIRGFEIYRSPDGLQWEKAAQDGFGDPVNTSAINTWCMFTVHNGFLYAVTIKSPRVVLDGAQVWRTGDGLTWERVSDYGFGDIANNSFWQLVIFRSHFFVGTMNRTLGAEIWTTMPQYIPPVITSIYATPDTLWPPNHKMKPVTITIEFSDNSEPAPICRIVSVSSNEPAYGKGYGNKYPDWKIKGPLTLKLRAERSGKGEGRVYTITVLCRFADGSSTTKTVTVTVPHHRKS